MCDSLGEEAFMTESVRQAIQSALRENPSGLKAMDVARRMGINVSSLYRWGESADQDIPLARLVQLVLVTGDTRPVSAICRLVGGLFVTEKPACMTKETVTEATVKAIKEFSDLAQEVSGDIIDGSITEDELLRVRREAMHAQQAIEFALLHA